jgi:hypothetical protein
MTVRITALEVDLFGKDVMQRGARFVGGCRITLTRRWGPGPRACVIGHNPSDAGADRDDPTSRWWNAWFRLFGFGSYVAVNLYPWCSADPADVYRKVEDLYGGVDWGARDELHFINLPTVVQAAKSADQVFVCWGAIARDHAWIEHVIEEIQSGEAPYPDLYCWGTTAARAPKHPMARGLHRIAKDQAPILWRPAR